MKKVTTFKISVLITFLFLLGVTVLSISANFYVGSKKITLGLADQLMKESAQKMVEITMYYLYAPALQTKALGTFLKESAPENLMKIHKQLWEQMWAQLLVFPQLESIVMADIMGNYMQARRFPELATRYIDRTKQPAEEKWFYRNIEYDLLNIKDGDATYDPRIRPWYKNTHSESKIYWTDTYIFNTTQEPGISISYPVSYQQNENIDAVISLNVPLQKLSNFLADQKVSKNGLVFIVDKEGKLIAYPEQSRLVKQDANGELRLSHINELEKDWVNDVYHLYLKTGQTTLNTTTGGKNYLSRVVNFPETTLLNWKIVVIIPEEDLLGSVNSLLLEVFLISLGIFLIGGIFVVIFANRITKPIVALANQTNKIKNFELDHFKQARSSIYEIELMNNSIFSMVQGLQSFRRYVPAALVRQLINMGKEAQLGVCDETELTILFTDVKDFTTISENMEAQALMLHLSDYFEHLSNIIMEEKGTIDKYIGDAIMGFWGAPVKLPNAALLACRAALRCQKKLNQLNKQWVKENKPPMITRMGIHSGMTMVGNLGSQDRMNYTVIGDSVNLASRLEGINKYYGTEIIISESTYLQVSSQFLCRPLDIVAVKGKRIGVKVYELIADKSEFIAEETLHFCNHFTEGFGAYLKQDWKTALGIFETLQQQFPNNQSVALFIKRCQTFQQQPLPEDWNGITSMHEK
ncbi:MAG: hypothetical protein RIT27_2492 [Pseudomonadota bacterium]|jgi:adenylate cyclase